MIGWTGKRGRETLLWTGRHGLARESQGPACELVSRGKGLCGVREDSDCSAEVCADPVVGTNGVLKGQDQRGISGRHVDSSGPRAERGGEGGYLGSRCKGLGDGDETGAGEAERTPCAKRQPNLLHSPPACPKRLCGPRRSGDSGPGRSLPTARRVRLRCRGGPGQHPSMPRRSEPRRPSDAPSCG